MKLSVFAFTLLVVFIGCCSCEEQDNNGAQTVDKIMLQPAKHPKPSPVLKSRVVCPDTFYTCPNGFTCCRMFTGKWGCCPHPNAVCCSDGKICCPEGYKCNVSAGQCFK